MDETSKPDTPSHTKRFRLWVWAILFLAIPGLLVLGSYAHQLDKEVQSKFEGKRWSVPSRVYARALELYPQKPLTVDALQTELTLVSYQSTSNGLDSGSYWHEGDEFVITTRTFRHWDSEEPARSIRLTIDNDVVASLSDALTNEPLPLVRLEPMMIGIIHPANQEDRVLVRLNDLPRLLPAALQAMEDRKFAKHAGIDFRGIIRAAWANLRAGKVVQGGSTLTQQLVKNFFLDSERSFTRKFNEALMSLLLEWRYDKDDILEAYANEIYLGQDGKRAIHGFGLASHFYFNKPPQELTLADSALLVAIVRGPAYYNPRRHPGRALARRNLVIETLLSDGLISEEQAVTAQAAPLGVKPYSHLGNSRYPAFMELVKRQLHQDYREEDLRSEGLRIFTTLDPVVQERAETALQTRIESLEHQRALTPGTLEGGVIVTRLGNAEISAVVGGRQARYVGFNRALDIQRPVGSLLKPALYLTALAQPDHYTLASLVKDETIELRAGGKSWSPANYNGVSHGEVTIIEALKNSYNQAAVNLGLEVGVAEVIDTINTLGVEKSIPAYPSVLLGSVEMAPVDVAQMYQTLADEGFYTPQRAVREVLDAHMQPLQRYPLDTQQRFAPEHVYLVNTALQMVLREGTGKRIGRNLPQNISFAGKTGTTDDLRDSWFAGFSNDYLGVVWIGNDDNAVTGLTGSSGALPIWADIISKISVEKNVPSPPVDIETVEIDLETGLLASSSCGNKRRLPFVKNTAPEEYAPCAGNRVTRSVDTVVEKFMSIFR